MRLKSDNVFKVPGKVADRVCTQEVEGYYHLMIIIILTLSSLLVSCLQKVRVYKELKE